MKLVAFSLLVLTLGAGSTLLSGCASSKPAPPPVKQAPMEGKDSPRMGGMENPGPHNISH